MFGRPWPGYANLVPDASADRNAAEQPASSFEVVVIGAGQAGLAMGCFLARQGRPFVVLEAPDSLGAGWRRRGAARCASA
jgi:putative flavoprotein involved in K+ transport